MFSRFDRIPACDVQTDRQTSCDVQHRAVKPVSGKNPGQFPPEQKAFGNKGYG